MTQIEAYLENIMTDTKAKLCSVKKCDVVAFCKSLCRKHYTRMMRHGNPETCFSNRNLSPEQRFWLKVDQSGSCWEWKGYITVAGYGQIQWFGKTIYAHRISYFLRHNIMPSKFILHSCDNRKCVNPDHLREGDAKDNAADMVERNRNKRGSQVYNSKLTESQVIYILQKIKEGSSSASLARIYSVSTAAIHQIRIGANWKHVQRSKYE